MVLECINDAAPVLPSCLHIISCEKEVNNDNVTDEGSSRLGDNYATIMQSSGADPKEIEAAITNEDVCVQVMELGMDDICKAKNITLVFTPSK